MAEHPPTLQTITLKMQLSNNSESGSVPASPRDESSDLVFITYNGRQVVLGYSPSLEQAKSTACDDLGLSERGYSGKDIAFLFHPANDPTNPLIEVLPSAWPKLRPLPHFQLLLRSEEEVSSQLSSPATPNHPQQQRNDPHHHHRTLRTQSSSLTNCTKSHTSREGDLASASNTDGSGRSVRVDVESWRRNQVGHPHPHPHSLAHQAEQVGYLQQSHVSLPQHALPSPPMSDAHSHRGISPFDESRSSTPSSTRSEGMDLDEHVHLKDTQSPFLVPPPHPSGSESNTAGFLAQTGRRTTVHFPHTLPNNKNKPEIIAPTPIRRSQSQEMLNADYTNFKLGQTQGHAQSGNSIPGAVPSQQHLAPKVATVPKQQKQDASNTMRSLKLSSSSASRPVHHAVHPPAKQLPRPSSLRQSWDSSTPYSQDSAAGKASTHGDQADIYSARRLRPAGMQRSSSHSSLTIGMRPPLADYNNTSYFPSSEYNPLQCLPGEPPAISQLGMPFNMPFESYIPRRASLPDAYGYTPVAKTTRPTINSFDSAPPVGYHPSSQNPMTRRVPAPIVDAEMDPDSSEDETSWKNRSKTLQTTPKRSMGGKTLRRLKSSPSGLADQYSRRADPLDAGMRFADPEPLTSGVPQLSSSTKRGPTSWPNSPVKRNASLFSPNTGSKLQTKDGFSMEEMSFAPPTTMPNLSSALARTSSTNRKKEGHAPLSPPPPPPPLAPGADPLTERALARGILGSAVPPFLLDKKRPDSPLPPLYSFRSLPPSPQALSPGNNRSPFHTFSSNTTINTMVEPSSLDPPLRFKNGNSQSAENLFKMASAGISAAGTAFPDYPPLPKTRSQLSLSMTNTTKSRRTRTH